MNVSVLIGTYGDPAWRDQAARAKASALALDPPARQVIARHDDYGTLASCRNALAEWATGDWLCFLDGDDELDPGYLAPMEAALAAHIVANSGGYVSTWDGPMYVSNARLAPPALLAPAVQYVAATGRRQRPAIPTKHHCDGDIRRGSWLVIGTLVPRSMFRAVGGFRDYPLYEDWALFAACWKAGCQIIEVPSAVYVAHMRQGSRNRVYDQEARRDAHRQITADLFPELLLEDT